MCTLKDRPTWHLGPKGRGFCSTESLGKFICICRRNVSIRKPQRGSKIRIGTSIYVAFVETLDVIVIENFFFFNLWSATFLMYGVQLFKDELINKWKRKRKKGFQLEKKYAVKWNINKMNIWITKKIDFN